MVTDAAPLARPADAEASAAFDRVVLRAEQTRAWLLMIFFGALLAAILVRVAVAFAVAVARDTSGELVDLGAPLAILVFLGGMTALEAWLLRDARHRLRDGLAPSDLAAYVTVVVEIGAYAVGNALLGTTGDGVIVVLMTLVALSAFRLNAGATLLAGGAAAVAYLALTVRVDPAAFQNVGGGEAALWTAGLMVAASVAVALMARSVRRAAVLLATGAVEQQRLQADLLESVEATQARIGRELHDGVGSHLTGLSFFVRGLVKRLERGGPVAVAEMTDAAEMVGDAVGQVRRLSRGLTPSEMEPGELASALADLAAAATKATDISVTSRTDDDLPGLGAEVEAHLYRIAQEALTNALRHGRPAHVDVALEADGRGVVLTVEDDGRGIAAGGGPGIGLRTMGHRATLAGGALDVEARDGGGTVVRVVVASRPGAG